MANYDARGDLPELHPGIGDLIRVLGKLAHCASRTVIVCEPSCAQSGTVSKYHKNCSTPKKGRSYDSLCRPSSLWSPVLPDSYYYDCFFYGQYPDRDTEYRELEEKYNAIKQNQLDYSPPECDEEEIDDIVYNSKAPSKTQVSNNFRGLGRNDESSKTSARQAGRNEKRGRVSNEWSDPRGFKNRQYQSESAMDVSRDRGNMASGPSGRSRKQVGVSDEWSDPRGYKNKQYQSESAMNVSRYRGNVASGQSGRSRKQVGVSDDRSDPGGFKSKQSDSRMELAKDRGNISGSRYKNNLFPEDDYVPCAELQEIRDLLRVSDRETIRRMQELLSIMKELSVRDICRATCEPLKSEEAKRVTIESTNGSKPRFKKEFRDDPEDSFKDARAFRQQTGSHQSRMDDYGPQKPSRTYEPAGDDYAYDEGYGPLKSIDPPTQRGDLGNDGSEAQGLKGRLRKEDSYGGGNKARKNYERNDDDYEQNDDPRRNRKQREPRQKSDSPKRKKETYEEEDYNRYDPKGSKSNGKNRRSGSKRSVSSSTSTDSNKNRRLRRDVSPDGSRKAVSESDSDLTESSSPYSESSSTDVSRGCEGKINPESSDFDSDFEPMEKRSTSKLPRGQMDVRDRLSRSRDASPQSSVSSEDVGRPVKQRPKSPLMSNLAAQIPADEDQPGAGANYTIPVGKEGVPMSVQEIVELSNNITDVVVLEIIKELLNRGVYNPPSSRDSGPQPRGASVESRMKSPRSTMKLEEPNDLREFQQTGSPNKLSRIEESYSSSLGLVDNGKREKLKPCPRHSRSQSLSPACRLEIEKRSRSDGDRRRETSRTRDEERYPVMPAEPLFEQTRGDARFSGGPRKTGSRQTSATREDKGSINGSITDARQPGNLMMDSSGARITGRRPGSRQTSATRDGERSINGSVTDARQPGNFMMDPSGTRVPGSPRKPGSRQTSATRDDEGSINGSVTDARQPGNFMMDSSGARITGRRPGSRQTSATRDDKGSINSSVIDARQPGGGASPTRPSPRSTVTSVGSRTDGLGRTGEQPLYETKETNQLGKSKSRINGSDKVPYRNQMSPDNSKFSGILRESSPTSLRTKIPEGQSYTRIQVEETYATLKTLKPNAPSASEEKSNCRMAAIPTSNNLPSLVPGLPSIDPTAPSTVGEPCEPDDLIADTYDIDSSVLYYARLTKNAFPPAKETYNAAGFMLRSAYRYVIPPRRKVAVKTDLVLELPRNSYGRIAPRKCMVENYGIDVVADVIDRDYKGNLMVVLYNHGDRQFTVDRGNKIAMLICESIHLAKVVENRNLIENNKQ